VVACTAAGLAERGHDVTALVPVTAGLPPLERHDGLTLIRRLRRGAAPVTFTDFAGGAAFGRSRRRAFDLVLGHTGPATSGLIAAGVEGRFVFVFHAPELRELQYNRSKAETRIRRAGMRALEPVLGRLERTAISRSALVLALSEYTRGLMTQDYPEAASRLVRVTGGVDVDAFSPGEGRNAARARLRLDGSGPLLVTVRRLEPRMGLEGLLAAVRDLGRPDLRLVVGGVGSRREALERLARDLGVADRVHFAGLVPEEDLVDLYRAADLFVLPTVAYEGFGMVTLEALASGTPVIGTPVGATPELLEPLEPRLVADSASPADLSVAIERGLELATDELRARCREYAVARYSWDRVVDHWEEALLEAAA
jgi:glycosyltransferase involved in cell wall biosynthesis